MTIFEPLRRGAEELWDSIGEGWERLRDRSASALTRFRRTEAPEDDALLPAFLGGDSWGLLASELAETDDEVVVRIEAPGLEEKDFSIAVVSDELVVRGQKRFERESRDARYHLLESAYGAFERRFALPCAVEADRAKARYRHGVLSVRLPRAESGRRRRILVKAS